MVLLILFGFPKDGFPDDKGSGQADAFQNLPQQHVPRDQRRASGIFGSSASGGPGGSKKPDKGGPGDDGSLPNPERIESISETKSRVDRMKERNCNAQLGSGSKAKKQAKYKTPKHGKIHGLPVNSNNKTPKTDANAVAMTDSIANMPNRKETVWYTDGQYQGGTERGIESVNLFDPETNVIAVFQKREDGTAFFLTTCELGDVEVDHLESSNGNFLTEEMIMAQTAVDFPRNANSQNAPINTDVSPNPMSTPVNSFESDVLGITPRNDIENL